MTTYAQTLHGGKALESLSRDMAKDPSRFAEARSDSAAARAALASVGISTPSGVEVRLLQNESDVMHFALPLDPNSELSDVEVDGLSADGGTAHSTMSSALTIPSTLSTLSTINEGSTRIG